MILLLLLAVGFIVVSTTKFNLHPFLALLFVSIFFGLFSGMPLEEIAKSIQEGFGGTLGSIGILIIAGTIIGVFLEKSGGAMALAEKVLKLIGAKQLPAAMALMGYIIGIPVFADSAFVILTPLNRALTQKAGLSFAATSVALGLGVFVAHTMVPPTPGPIAAAGILKADLGMVIALAIPVSLLTMIPGWLWAIRFASRTVVDVKKEVESENDISSTTGTPPAWQAILPVVVPLALIVLGSVAALPSHPMGENNLVVQVIGFLGEPTLALLVGVLIAFALPQKFSTKLLGTDGWVGKGLADAAIIIMITGAGGAFGKVLQNSGIASLIGDSLGSANLGIWLPFLLAAGIKSAQGSSTVALITAASIVAPVLESLGLDSGLGRALAVLEIGAGALVVSHANDSFFWIFTQMTGMEVGTGYRLLTSGTLIMGVSAAILVWIASLLLL